LYFGGELKTYDIEIILISWCGDFSSFISFEENLLTSNGFLLVTMGVKGSQRKAQIILEGEKKDWIDHLDYQLI
jgi:hypothetical protein